MGPSEHLQSALPGCNSSGSHMLVELVEYLENGGPIADWYKESNGSPWLAEFTSANPNYASLHSAFARDETLFVGRLRNFFDAYRKYLFHSEMASSMYSAHWTIFCAGMLQERDENRGPMCERLRPDVLRQLAENTGVLSVPEQTDGVRRCALRLLSLREGDASGDFLHGFSPRSDEERVASAIERANDFVIDRNITFDTRDTIEHLLDLLKRLFPPRVADKPFPWAPKSLGIFLRNLKALGRLVGGDVRLEHASVVLNINEVIVQLQNIAVSRMPFITALQQTIQQQQDKIDQQQEVVEALMFRHLLEHLPGGGYKGMNATDAWIAFWEDAMDELGVSAQIEKAEKPKDDPNGDLGYKFEGESSEGAKSPSISSREQEAFALQSIVDSRLKRAAFEKGKWLYGELSTAVHRYQGGAYEVSKTNWGPTQRDIFEALKPIYFDEHGDVVWDKERRRYLRKPRARAQKESETEAETSEDDDCGFWRKS